jgi:hypothetical protein
VRYRPARRATARLGVVLTAAALAASTAAAAASATAASPAAGAQGAATPTVLLVNGARLIPGAPGAPGAARVLPGAASALAGELVALGSGRSGLVIPRVALPYLGRGLDPALFRLSSLQAAEAGGRLPVTVAYRGKLPSLPGVHLTGGSGGVARGYLTAAGARAFGAALAGQFLADHAKGSYGQDGMFADGVSVSLAGSPAGAARAAQAPRHSPGFRMHTLTVTATNTSGQPDTGDDVTVLNADSLQRFDDPIESDNFFSNGVTKFSVPAGHYWAIGDFFVFSGKGPPSERLDVLPQFTVSANSTVVMSAAAASSQISMVTTRPTVLGNLTVEFRRGTADGHTFSASWGANFPIYISPTTKPPTVGKLAVATSAQLLSPSGTTGTPYQYNLAYGDTSGLIPSGRHVVTPASLATVNASYYSDVTGTGAQYRFGILPIQHNDFFLIPINPFPVPSQETEYMTGNPGIQWGDSYSQTYNNMAGGQSDDYRSFQAGEQTSESWNAYPLHEGYNVNLVGTENLSPTLPSASRTGDALTLDVTPFSDSTPGHGGNGGFIGGQFGPVDHITGHYLIAENGKTIASGNPLKKFAQIGIFGEFDTHVTLSPHPGTVRFVLDSGGSGKIFGLTTSSHTVWTWRSAHEAGGTLPAGWTCKAGFQGLVHPARSCAVEPMMTLGYAVAGLSLTGSAPAGAQVVQVTAGHLQLAGAVAVTGAQVAVSFDGGKSWHPAQVTGSAGSYTASFTAPAGVKVSLRTSAADAAGGTVTETLINAYQVAS